MELFGLLRGGEKTQQSPQEVIETLCGRLGANTLLEDRRAAVSGLRSFAREFKTLVGSQGLDGLVSVIKNDKDDVELLKNALECVNTLCTVNDSEDVCVNCSGL